MVWVVKNSIIKWIIISLSFLLCTTHVIHIFNSGISINQVMIPISIILAFAVKKESRILYSISFVLVGFFSVLTLPELANIAPFPFFFLAIYYEPKNSIKKLIPGVLVSAFAISYQINSFDNYINLIEGIFGNLAFIGLFYLIFIKQPSKINHLSKVTPLSCRQLLILKYLSLDIPRKQIVDKVSEKELWKYDIDNFTLDIINSEIAKIKKILNIDSEFSLGVWYNKKTEIN